MIYSLANRQIETHGDDYFVAPSADVIGSVRLGRWASVWFNAVLRGDNDWIEIGDGTNVQDGTVMHTDSGVPLIVGANTTIGHKAFLHACRVGDHSLIANGAMILDGATIGSYSIVAAGAFVPPRKTIPDGVVVMGNPAQVVREITEKDRYLLQHAALHYQDNAKRYRTELVVR
ncbi:carbonic anhydrase/acetyltransferase-like protein (isoleucine patch superfamily) [Povalibacter uvarum]|uniref:Carbonic anhydrase/acetyltransferase-like protein (Isoleucine patch superfamily) n=1 Tax=Povalibacter uvarum TaxID=732238 RepID=A0A841HS11_9GAMM|nr:gamma carbonic anhydrase family protein [Povalibacter uvarum]MBB6094812.1 carbonic anhydrase/acetyltransferase-like protein (isoleucine patch superfamily) [Povalibacter uvarum]